MVLGAAALLHIAAMPTALASVPLVGGVLASVGTTLTAPLMILAAPLCAGGALFLALPVLSWMRGKNRAKKEILQKADNEIVRHFAEIENIKVEMLRSQGSRLCMEIEREFNRKAETCKAQLAEAKERKKNLLREAECARKAEQDGEMLKDLLAEEN